jgi:hypothetical protein
MPGAAFVIVDGGDDISEPLIARSYAREESIGMGRPSLHEAYKRVGRGYKEDNIDQHVRCYYRIPDDSVLLMIGNTEELLEECRVARSTEPQLIYIATDNGKILQFRYARIQVSRVPVIGRGQTDTLIALGAKLPPPSEKGWHEPKEGDWRRGACKWPEEKFLPFVDLNDLPGRDLRMLQSRLQSLPGWIRSIKEFDGKKWIDA